MEDQRFHPHIFHVCRNWMSLDSIDVFSDSRVSHHEDLLNGNRYRMVAHSYVINGHLLRSDYLLGEPSGDENKGTIFLAHGWPDLCVGWRNQIPMLTSIGYRVVCPDNLGYGGSDVPRVPPSSIEKYSLKTAADNIKLLAAKLECNKIYHGRARLGKSLSDRLPTLIDLLSSSFVRADSSLLGLLSGILNSSRPSSVFACHMCHLPKRLPQPRI